ncbi:MAG TPA: sigma-70 family RNA polymerase sigma factor [Phycisphaerales bacterium]|nr:sigma-70 family RNA polymerase sigma factor [Phycisphaerales bacterium]
MFTTTTAAVDTIEQSDLARVEPSTKDRGRRLTASEEAEFARAWRSRADAAARERLITANLGLVVAIASRYRDGGVPLEELIAEGNLGLVRAVDGFNPECGSRFSTYAAYWIRQGISTAFAASTPRGRLSGSERRDLSTYERALKRFYALTGRSPTDAEMVEALRWSNERVAACRDRRGTFCRPTSLEQPRTVGIVRTTEPDRKASPPMVVEPELRARVARLLSHLSPFERAIVEMRFGLHGGQPQTIGAISHSINRPKREVSGTLRAAMASLSKSARRQRVAGQTAAARARRSPEEGTGAAAPRMSGGESVE